MNAFVLDKEILRSPSQESDIVDLVYESAVPVAAEYLEDIHLELSSSEKQDTSSGKNVRARYILAHKSHHHVPS
ncbi:hypothetical protein NC653_012104 [Populus alba x Populus x berolinensis]|uniref:Uncharacterized protein n=1 Tax=Populus alba x Populus x berolinensis TaxID=444605 RepID=A0AAD6R488_9ROSI|nr:hypothetical protein NC653_012104 [Populus alba x Populus x berolinensis]